MRYFTHASRRTLMNPAICIEFKNARRAFIDDTTFEPSLINYEINKSIFNNFVQYKFSREKHTTFPYEIDDSLYTYS